jgi:hypothetical protein
MAMSADRNHAESSEMKSGFARQYFGFGNTSGAAVIRE